MASVVIAVAGLGSGLGACGAEGSAERPSSVEGLDLSELEAASTTPSRTAPSTTSAAAPPTTTSSTTQPTPSAPTTMATVEAANDPAACARLEAVFSDPVVLEVHQVEGEPRGTSSWFARLRAVGEDLPADLAVRWARFMEQASRVFDDPPTNTAADLAEGEATYLAVTAWVGATCPSRPPTWACPSRETFTPVGRQYDEDGGVVAPAATVDELVAGWDHGADAVELDRADGEVLFGWFDEAGLVRRAIVVQRGEDGWSSGPSTSCRQS